MSSPKALTIEQLKHALHLAGEVARLQVEIHAILGTDNAVPNASTSLAVSRPKKGKGKRTMSPEAKAKIAAAQKARWAKVKGTKAPTPAVIEKIAKIEAAAPKAKKKKRNISPEAKARMVEAGKRRWAKQKAAKTPTAKAKAKIAQAGQPKFKVL